MPPTIASIIVMGFVAFLLRREIQAKPNVTKAWWLPFLWFFLISTRTLAQWIQTFTGGMDEGSSNEEGTPIDAGFFFLLIIAGMVVLQRRQFSLGVFVRDNRWLFLFLIYSLLSVFWSDFMFISLKRWIKIIGHPVMVLVLLTEPDPEEAITQLMKWCSIIIFPVSILFIKYYPMWGRMFDPFIGAPSNTGISLDKNMLGSICMVLGAFLFWHWLKVRRRPRSRERSEELKWMGVLWILCFYVMHEAHSATSLVTMFLSMAIIAVLGSEKINKQKLGTYLVTTVVVVLLAQWVFGLFDLMLGLLGKDLTLTDRTKVWAAALQVEINPIFGTGFECFWMGPRLKEIWAMFWWHPIQAHDGYLETYLNLGLIGLTFMVGLLVVAFRQGTRALVGGEDFARFRLGFLAAYVLYNVTEAAFKAQHPVWFVFFIIVMQYPLAATALEKPGPVVDTGLPDGYDEADARA